MANISNKTKIKAFRLLNPKERTKLLFSFNTSKENGDAYDTYVRIENSLGYELTYIAATIHDKLIESFEMNGSNADINTSFNQWVELIKEVLSIVSTENLFKESNLLKRLSKHPNFNTDLDIKKIIYYFSAIKNDFIEFYDGGYTVFINIIDNILNENDLEEWSYLTNDDFNFNSNELIKKIEKDNRIKKLKKIL